MELHGNAQCVATSAGPGCTWQGPSCIPRLASTSSEPGNRPSKGPQLLETCHHLPLPLWLSLQEPLAVASCLRWVLRESPGRDEQCPWADMDLNLVPMLGQRLLSKCLGVHQGRPHLLGACRPWRWGRVSGVAQVRPAEFIRLEQTKVWLCGRRALHRNNGITRHAWGKWPPT